MDNTHTADISIHLDKGEYLKTTVQKRKKTPNFTKVGNGKMNKHSIKSVDFLQELMDMTKAEQLVIATIKNLYVWDAIDGEVFIPLSKTFSKSETVVFLKGFKLLKAKNLVRRTKTSHYMINPDAIFLMDYDKGILLWDSVEDMEA